MANYKRETIERHIKTHTERSAEDKAAVSTLEYFLKSDGKINPIFASNDKWPTTSFTIPRSIAYRVTP